MTLTRRARLAASAALLLIASAAALPSCQPAPSFEPNPCNTGMELPALTCGVGTCYAFTSACDANGLPATCTPSKPQAEETCDGIDNNCDGVIDEGCPCTEGAEQACYRATPETRSVGACHDGTQECKNGVWGDCVGDQLAAPETCDQRDNDCDGKVDNGCDCVEGQEQPCYGGAESTLNQGACKAGKQSCEKDDQGHTAWGDCVGDVLPMTEVANGRDDDCDGEIDEVPGCPEGAEEPCFHGDPMTIGVGPCKAGTQTCNGTPGLCEGEVLPTTEVCNGIDDDCNGTIDDVIGLGVACVSPLPGPCQNGITTCTNTGLECNPIFLPTPETCDGIDNDCDGIIDNGNFCCPDGAQDGAETDVDCGAICPIACGDLKKCGAAKDCQSGVCAGGICVAPTCIDGVKNSLETDIDCGGPVCPKCAVLQHCLVAADCQTNGCMNGICIFVDCSDGVKNGLETDVDCGGPACAGCAPGQQCLAPSDCTSGVCAGNVCQAPTCADGVENGSESDVDCGGPACPQCPSGSKCNLGADCQNNVCMNGLCAP